MYKNRLDYNQDFFEIMRDAKQVEINSKYNTRQGILYLAMGLFSIFFELMTLQIIPINNFTTILIAVSFVFFVVSFIFYTISAFQKNNYHFKNGDMSKGIKNYVISGIFVWGLLLIFYFTSSNNESKEFISSLFAPITTVLAAILAIMGVHYTHCKQQKNIVDKDRLIFIHKSEEDAFKVNINECSNGTGINISLFNVTNNYGYFVGLYKVHECEIHEIGTPITYQPILPQKSYLFTSISIPLPDEKLVLVFKDVSDNHYYIRFDYDEVGGISIIELDKCDIYFLNDSIQKTILQEEKLQKKDKKVQTKQERILSNANDDFTIKKRKQETKPVFVHSFNGYDLILSEDGTLITDIDLLEKLQKERLKISRETKTKAYMIFNNQQLVAIATYKPTNKDEFIAIYGLGEKKYELYGEQMINLYK